MIGVPKCNSNMFLAVSVPPSCHCQKAELDNWTLLDHLYCCQEVQYLSFNTFFVVFIYTQSQQYQTGEILAL